MYKIAYIDESKTDIHDFQDYFKHAPSAHYFQLEVLEPQPDIEAFVKWLLESHFQAYIIDFHLSEKNSLIGYTGWDLGKKILSVRDKFPVFILTSYQVDAQNDTDDVNIIYSKIQVVEKEDNNFLERVRLQIEKYEKAIENDETRLLTLINLKETRPLNAPEEAELIELDTKIERTLNRKISIPKQLKESSNETKMNEMLNTLNKMDEILERYANSKSI